MINRVAVVKFRMDNVCGDGAGCFFINSLDFKNAYFCCWKQNIGGGLANIWGPVPPAPV